MERGNWKRPVVLEMFGRPGLVTVSDTLEAAMLLLGGWPHKGTDSHVAAIGSCRDVLMGRGPASLSRADFIDAALDAGFHIQPETFIEESMPALITFAAMPLHSAGPPLPLIEAAYTEEAFAIDNPPSQSDGMTEGMDARVDGAVQPQGMAARTRSLDAAHSRTVRWDAPEAAAAPAAAHLSQPAIPLNGRDLPGLPQLLARLAETLGMIGLVMLRDAAGMLNIDLRGRAGRSEIGPTGSAGTVSRAGG